jgi:hypothetical protein
MNWIKALFFAGACLSLSGCGHQPFRNTTIVHVYYPSSVENFTTTPYQIDDNEVEK